VDQRATKGSIPAARRIHPHVASERRKEERKQKRRKQRRQRKDGSGTDIINN